MYVSRKERKISTESRTISLVTLRGQKQEEQVKLQRKEQEAEDAVSSKYQGKTV